MTEFLPILPEVFLALTLALVIGCEITYFGEQVRLITAISLVGLAASLLQAIFTYQYKAALIFWGALSVDGFSLFFKILFILLAALSIFSLSHLKEISESKRTEYCALIIAAVLAMCFVVSAADLLFAFLALLFLNVISYFLTAYGHRSLASTEASVKLMVFGAVAGTLFLYAASMLFSYTHSLNIYELHRILVEKPLSPVNFLVIFVLSFLSLSFQLGAFPMQLVIPDVLEGAPTPVSGFLSSGMRAAGFALCARFLIGIFAQSGQLEGHWAILGNFDWTQVVSFVSGMTMLMGALLAYRQTRAKRMVGSLVVSQTGFLLMGLLVLDESGISALLFNLVIELFSLVGIFYVIGFFIDELQSDHFERIRGIFRKSVPECICLILFLFCLVGAPPTPGFIGKFALIGAAMRYQHFTLALFSIISMVICIASVARLAFQLVGDFKRASGEFRSSQLSRKIFLATLVLPIVVVGIFADFVLNWAGQSLEFIFW